MKKTVSFGEIVWDVFKDGKVLGGAPLNFAYYCSKLGCNSEIVSAVGRDSDGLSALETIASHGVSTNLISTNSHPTGEVIVSLDSGRNAAYQIVKDRAWDFIEFNANTAKIVADADVFEFGTLAQRSETSRNTLARYLDACKPDCIKALDVNLRQKYFNREILDFSLTRADIVKMNDAELEKICDIFRYNGDSLMRAKFIFDAFALKYLVLTRGAEGYTIFEKGGMFMGKAKEIKVVDTVGAGDSFFAAFISSIINGSDAETSADAATALASHVCTHRGAFCL